MAPDRGARYQVRCRLCGAEGRAGSHAACSAWASSHRALAHPGTYAPFPIYKLPDRDEPVSCGGYVVCGCGSRSVLARDWTDARGRVVFVRYTCRTCGATAERSAGRCVHQPGLLCAGRAGAAGDAPPSGRTAGTPAPANAHPPLSKEAPSPPSPRPPEAEPRRRTP